jgi:flagellar biosynthesis/type III secretory pathway protein FliH
VRTLLSKIIRSAKKVEIARLAEIKHEAAGPKDFLSDPLDSASADLSDEEILSRAESEARRVLADARNQVADIQEKAHAQGYESGFERARGKGKNDEKC